MKILRAIGLAAIAALALIAVSGAGSAAAAETTLCKSAAISPYCASKDRYPKETAIEATKTEFQVDPGFGPTGITVCAESAMKGQTNAQAGEPLSASISTWTFSGCTRNGKACTITAKNLSYAGSLSWSSGDDGALALSNSGKGQPRLFVHCGSWYECEWDMPSLAVEGGNPGQLAIPTTTLVKGTGFNCPATTTLKATYSVSSPKPVFVARGEISNPGTGLCKINQSPCPQAYLYPEGTELEAETSDVKIETNVSTITCSEGSLAAQTTARSDNPLPLEMTAFALDGCNFPGVGSCSVSVDEFGSGSITWHSEFPQWGSTLAWRMVCGGSVDCTFRFGGADFEDGSPAVIGMVKRTLVETAKSGPLCPEPAVMSAQFTVTTPDPVYVVGVS